jgi:hypothetical protein
VYNWQLIASTGNLNVWTINDLTTGVLYDFKVQAHNDVGFGEFSPYIRLMAAVVPEQPAAPTKFSADQTQITI